MAQQWDHPQHGGDPFGGADPFGGDPFGADPFGGGASRGGQTWGSSPQPASPRPVPSAPVATPPQRHSSPPAPSPADSEKTVRISPSAKAAAPSAAASAHPLAGYLLSGVATVLVTVAIITGLALPELNMFYGNVTVVTLAAVGGLAVLAGVLLWQALRCARGQARARQFALIGCALTVLAAAAVWVVAPGEQVSWYLLALRITSVLGGIGAVATAALLLRAGQPNTPATKEPAQPAPPAGFPSPMATAGPAAAPAHSAARAPLPPPPGALRGAPAPAPPRPTPGADFDPFS